MSLAFTAHGATDVGRKRRRNEDAYLLDPELGVFAVADGMGGHAAGDVASKRAVEAVRAYLAERKGVLQRFGSEPSVENRVAAERLIQQAIQAACADVFHAARSDTKLGGMGTTFVCLAVAGDRGIVGHVGDSRLVLTRKGEAYRLTEDHTLMAGMVKAGELTWEQARTSPLRGVLTRALGQHESVEVDTLAIEILPGDALLLCSDGLHGYLTDEEIPALFAANTPDALPDELIRIANERGGQDNITALVITAPAEGEDASGALSRMNALRGIPLFEHMSYREQSAVLAIAVTRSYPEGATIVTQGEPGGDLFVLLDGEVIVESGGTAISSVRPGGHFGEMGLMDAGPRSATVRTLGPTRAMVISRDDMMGLMQQDAQMAVKLLWTFVQSLSLRLRATSSGLSDALLAGSVTPAPFTKT